MTSLPRVVVASVFALFCLSKFVLQGDMIEMLQSTHVSRRLRPTPRQMQRRAQDATLTPPFPYDITLNVTLHYLDEETAPDLEGLDPGNELVLHFCKSVNTQASAQQVRSAASNIGATVETKVSDSPDGDSTHDYQCTIVATNRDYDNDAEDTFGQGFFILQVSVRQVVFMTGESPNVPLSQDLVDEIVLTGFNRGDGGRARFRDLLRLHAGFSTVFDVGVLDSLSPPQSLSPASLSPSNYSSTLPPTFMPTVVAPSNSSSSSVSPSLVPSEAPEESPSTSSMPSSSQSQMPTVSPTTPPTWIPSKAPTERPSTSPSVMTFSGPSQMPTDLPPASSTDNQQPLIIGAIAGGIATIVVSLFFVFCVWFPLCGSKAEEDSSDTPDPVEGSLRCRPSNMSPSVLRSIVPDVVRLDDESESLANTTLGDTTAMGYHRKQPAKQHTAVDPASIRLFDSFDDGSIYTSGAGGHANDDTEAGSSLMVLPPSLSRTLDYEEYIVFPASGSASNSSAEGIIGFCNTTSTGNDDSDRDDELLLPSAASGSSSFFGAASVKSDEDRAKRVAQKMDSGTRGYDPFNEDASDSSSFEFETESVGEEDEHTPDDVASPSFSSAQTEKIHNLPLSSAPGDRQRLISPTEEEKREIDDEIREDTESIELFLPTSLPPGRQDFVAQEQVNTTTTKVSNNSLLRSVLEDARRLGQSKSLSRKSAPSRFSKKGKTNRAVEPPHDLLADHQDLEEHITLSNRTPRRIRTSSKSVGAALPTRRESRKENPVKSTSGFPDAPTTNNAGLEKATEAKPPHRTQSLEMNTGRRPYHFVPTSSPVAGKAPVMLSNASTPYIERTKSYPVTPLSSEASPVQEGGVGTLGAEPRDHNYETLKGGQNLPETPESPGVLGIAVPPTMQDEQDDASSESEGYDNPWLFDAIEQTLGPRSPAADMESISGRSSRSGKSSLKSQRSQRYSSGASLTNSSDHSSPKRTASRANDLDQVVRQNYSTNSHSSTTAPVVNGSHGDEHKSTSDDDPLTPRTLEYDLRRLEFQLGESRHRRQQQTEGDQTSTSSITASSTGASRPPLSSKLVTLRRSKKHQMVIVVPPGKLGVVLANRHDGNGTVVSKVKASSTMNGMLSPGDKLVAVDGEDVRSMGVTDITTIMASKVHKERRLTVLTKNRIEEKFQEAKYEQP